jgi:histidinol dehydrogenase
MGTVTARAAGVLEVVACTPPGPDGRIDPAVLAACKMCGVDRIYRMGGAQAIAALAYGAQSVEAVDVIVGPGNLYVQEAKRQCAGVVGIDLFAGPSDLLVVFEGSEHLEAIALDLLAQAEHGDGTLVVAASPQREALEQLQAQLQRLGEQSACNPSAYGLIQIADGTQGIELANALAPEHLQLIGADLEARSAQVRAAGCLFLGPYAGTAFGDYIAGSNHILPTAGGARFASGLSTATFRRRMYEVRMDARSAAALAQLAAPLAIAEGFPMHARSMLARGSKAGIEPQAKGWQ